MNLLLENTVRHNNIGEVWYLLTQIQITKHIKKLTDNVVGEVKKFYVDLGYQINDQDFPEIFVIPLNGFRRAIIEGKKDGLATVIIPSVITYPLLTLQKAQTNLSSHKLLQKKFSGCY